MLKLIGILVLSSRFSVAVETEKGFAEAAFANTSAGVEELIEFVERSYQIRLIASGLSSRTQRSV